MKQTEKRHQPAVRQTDARDGTEHEVSPKDQAATEKDRKETEDRRLGTMIDPTKTQQIGE